MLIAVGLLQCAFMKAALDDVDGRSTADLAESDQPPRGTLKTESGQDFEIPGG